MYVVADLQCILYVQDAQERDICMKTPYQIFEKAVFRYDKQLKRIGAQGGTERGHRDVSCYCILRQAAIVQHLHRMTNTRSVVIT